MTVEPSADKKRVTTSELLDNLIKAYSSPEEAKKSFQKILDDLKAQHGKTCSRALINKRVRKLYSKGFWTPEGEKPALPPAQEPIIKIEMPEQKEILEEPEPRKTLPEPKPIIETEEKPTEEQPREAGELTEEEKAKLRPIMVRSIKRTFGVVTDGLLKLGEKVGITEQESDDCITLLEIGLVKWTGTALEKYYFETTAILHFGSLAGKVFIASREKKREEEAKREEEDCRKKAMEEKAKEEPQKKLEPAKQEEKPALTKEKPYSSPPAFLTGAMEGEPT